MKKIITGIYTAVLFGIPCIVTAQAPSSPKLNAKIEAILAKMTVEEKVGQMAQVTLDVIGKGENRF